MKRILVAVLAAGAMAQAGIINPPGTGGTNITYIYSTTNGVFGIIVPGGTTNTAAFPSLVSMATTTQVAAAVAPLASVTQLAGATQNLATVTQLAGATNSLATVTQLAGATNSLATTGQVAAAQAACDPAGSSASVAALRASATVFGLGKVGAGLTAAAGVVSAPLGAYYFPTNYHATITWDCSTSRTLDITNNLTGDLALTCTNMVAGERYVALVTAGSISKQVSITFGGATATYATPNSFRTINVTANTMMILTIWPRADGSVLFDTTGPCTQ